MKISPDVESLMWMVAESADPQAIADFESRFPDLRYELSKRIDMVRELKSSRRLGEASGQPPRFTLHAPSRAPANRARFVLAFAALSVLAFGSFFAARFLAKPEPAKPTPVVEHVIQSPLASPSIQREPLPSGPPKPTIDAPVETNPVTPTNDLPWDKPLTVRFSRIRLQDALRAVAAQSGLALELAPGLENDEIVIDYQNMSGIAILADMGPRFGFTAFSQGEGRVLVIPARDPNAEPNSDEPTTVPRVERETGPPAISRSER